MKVHITLVGGQAAPVYHGIVATQPDMVSKDGVRVLGQLCSVVEISDKKINPLY